MSTTTWAKVETQMRFSNLNPDKNFSARFTLSFIHGRRYVRKVRVAEMIRVERQWGPLVRVSTYKVTYEKLVAV